MKQSRHRCYPTPLLLTGNEGWRVVFFRFFLVILLALDRTLSFISRKSFHFHFRHVLEALCLSEDDGAEIRQAAAEVMYNLQS